HVVRGAEYDRPAGIGPLGYEAAGVRWKIRENMIAHGPDRIDVSDRSAANLRVEELHRQLPRAIVPDVRALDGFPSHVYSHQNAARIIEEIVVAAIDVLAVDDGPGRRGNAVRAK